MWATPGPPSLSALMSRHNPAPPSPARMLLLLLLLPWVWGAPDGSLTLRASYAVVFHNASAAAARGLIRLGDLPTHSLDCGTCPIRFLQPWARQGLSPPAWQDLEALIHRALADFVAAMNHAFRGDSGRYPFVMQGSAGCELHPNGTSRGFHDVGMDGEDLAHFDTDAGAWAVRRSDALALKARATLAWTSVTVTVLQFYLQTTCVNGLKSFLQGGNASLQREERPVAVVFARLPPPTGPPSPWRLVCRVTGFYPRPVRVAWLQDGEEVGPGWQQESSGTLPNADQTYQLRSSLAVGPDEGHSYACRVGHSSLGGRRLLIPWERSRRWVPGLAMGLTLGALAAAAVAVGLWRRRQP